MQRYVAEAVGFVEVSLRKDDDGALYIAADVDVRITQLERALKSCAAVINAELKERRKFLQTADDALLEAEKALSL